MDALTDTALAKFQQQGSAQIHPVQPERLKEVRLDVTQALVDLGPEGKFAGWSFGGRIPGPTVRARVGDRTLLDAMQTPGIATGWSEGRHHGHGHPS